MSSGWISVGILYAGIATVVVPLLVTVVIEVVTAAFFRVGPEGLRAVVAVNLVTNPVLSAVVYTLYLLGVWHTASSEDILTAGWMWPVLGAARGHYYRGGVADALMGATRNGRQFAQAPCPCHRHERGVGNSRDTRPEISAGGRLTGRCVKDPRTGPRQGARPTAGGYWIIFEQPSTARAIPSSVHLCRCACSRSM